MAGISDRHARRRLAPDMLTTNRDNDQDTDLMGEGSKCFDYIAGKTGQDRHTCKCLIFALLYGNRVIGTCKQHGLTLDMVTDIRTAFDDFIEGS